MAVSVANVLENNLPYHIVGNKKEVCRDVTFDSKYQEKGEPLTRAELGLNSIEFATCTINAVAGSVNVASASYDPKEQLIHLYDETPKEVASEADVKDVVVRVVARGV